MTYRLEELKIFATPKADKMVELEGLAQACFSFPGVVRAVLFIHCGLVASSDRDREHYEIVGRLYESSDPQGTGEKHVGKLYVRVYGHPARARFETMVERLEWHEDGSFDTILPDGQRIRTTPPSP